MHPLGAAEQLARAVLLFHKPGPWTFSDRQEWTRLTGRTEATTTTICNLARDILKQESEQPT